MSYPMELFLTCKNKSCVQKKNEYVVIVIRNNVFCPGALRPNAGHDLPIVKV
jgi:hypothetical protein